MATDNSTAPATAAALPDEDDPIVEAQNAVMEAKALLGCLSRQLEGIHYEDTDIEPDMLAACNGVMRLLDKVGMDLDPQQFRRAVLATESAEVAHG
jgi:hypothetical protein